MSEERGYHDADNGGGDGEGPCVIYTSYMSSFRGFLQIIELVLGLIAWSCLASVIGTGSTPIASFVMFVYVSAWLTTLISFIFYLFDLPRRRWSRINWKILNFIKAAIFVVLYLIAFIINAARINVLSVLQAAAAFAFFTFCAYLVQVFVDFKEWKGSYPWIFFRTEGNVVTA